MVKKLRKGERKVTGFPRAKKGTRFLVIQTSKPKTVIVRKLKKR